MKLKTWHSGLTLDGAWVMSYKIDGVNVRIEGSSAFSKNEKALDNLVDCAGKLHDGLYEFYRNDWSETVSLLKNRARKEEITLDDFYRLHDPVDHRLFPTTMINVSATTVQDELINALNKGYEGLVFTNIDRSIGYKVKPTITYDLRVMSIIEGEGRTNKNMLGVAVVKYKDKLARVSSGFTKQQRVDYWKDSTFIDSIIEVAATNITPGGVLRHPRFIRRRYDKDTENYEI